MSSQWFYLPKNEASTIFPHLSNIFSDEAIHNFISERTIDSWNSSWQTIAIVIDFSLPRVPHVERAAMKNFYSRFLGTGSAVSCMISTKNNIPR